MANASPTTLRCTTCGTEFSSTNAAALQQHQGHAVEPVHLEQA